MWIIQPLHVISRAEVQLCCVVIDGRRPASLATGCVCGGHAAAAENTSGGGGCGLVEDAGELRVEGV